MMRPRNTALHKSLFLLGLTRAIIVMLSCLYAHDRHVDASNDMHFKSKLHIFAIKLIRTGPYVRSLGVQMHKTRGANNFATCSNGVGVGGGGVFLKIQQQVFSFFCL
jgi:hypothetical protein